MAAATVLTTSGLPTGDLFENVQVVYLPLLSTSESVDQANDEVCKNKRNTKFRDEYSKEKFTKQKAVHVIVADSVVLHCFRSERPTQIAKKSKTRGALFPSLATPTGRIRQTGRVELTDILPLYTPRQNDHRSCEFMPRGRSCREFFFSLFFHCLHVLLQRPC